MAPVHLDVLALRTVVYKARQVRLNRHRRAEDDPGRRPRHAPRPVARFLAEAEAVARLQHPNIVQIFEVGEHDGLPFFALEYVDGGSLARRLDGTPQPARRRRRSWSRRWPGAVHARAPAGHRPPRPEAGQRPADRRRRRRRSPTSAWPSSSTSSRALTRTGAILGTPSYMAPEQAEGRTKEVGPAADVYALGAILYELLTGRPPFRGDDGRWRRSSRC